jgi:hypothetical protein
MLMNFYLDGREEVLSDFSVTFLNRSEKENVHYLTLVTEAFTCIYKMDTVSSTAITQSIFKSALLTSTYAICHLPPPNYPSSLVAQGSIQF